MLRGYTYLWTSLLLLACGADSSGDGHNRSHDIDSGTVDGGGSGAADAGAEGMTTTNGSAGNVGFDVGAITDPQRSDCASCMDSALAGEECAEPSAFCYDYEDCGLLMDCVVAQGCLVLSREERVDCIAPCAANQGVNNASHPAAVMGGSLIACADDACEASCE